jgi:hypothetical protein
VFELCISFSAPHKQIKAASRQSGKESIKAMKKERNRKKREKKRRSKIEWRKGR